MQNVIIQLFVFAKRERSTKNVYCKKVCTAGLRRRSNKTNATPYLFHSGFLFGY